MDLNEIKSLVEKTGEAFEAFKKSNDENLKNRDVIIEEKMARIETDLDKAVEAKAALERQIAAEKKEREDLELRLSKLGHRGTGDDKFDVELKSFNDALKASAKDRQAAYEPVDADGYRAYKSAFRSFMSKDARLLTADEIKTLSVGSDPDGGYLVTPDTGGRIVTKVYETSEMRQIASSMTISSDKLEGIEDLGEAGAGYAGEAAQGSDSTTPQIGKWSIPVWIIDSEPKATQSILDDASVDVEAWLSGKVSDKFSRFENSEFVKGATKIRGFTSYTTAADSGSGVTWGQIGYVATGTSSAFGTTVATQADKLIDLMGLLKQAYLPNARWAASRAVLTLIRKFKIGATTDAYVWSPGLGVGIPETILGFPVSRMEDMPALGSDSLSMAFGDFRAAYQIVDRIGIRVLRDPFTSKPFVKFYTTKRTGGGVVNFEAIKLMKFGSS
jgi:HK97 family phage major capsid protein